MGSLPGNRLACVSATKTVVALPLSSVSCMSLPIQSPLQSVTSLLTLVVLADTAFLGHHTQFYGRHQQGQHTQLCSDLHKGTICGEAGDSGEAWLGFFPKERSFPFAQKCTRSSPAPEFREEEALCPQMVSLGNLPSVCCLICSFHFQVMTALSIQRPEHSLLVPIPPHSTPPLTSPASI